MAQTLARTLLKQTLSRCLESTCQALCPAEVWQEGTDPGQVIMTRTCSQHGEQRVVISKDARWYWTSLGAQSNECCSPGSGCCGPKIDPIDKMATCLALIEIVESCNLPCPTCYAASPLGSSGEKLTYLTLDEIKHRVEKVIARKGKVEILQLSGGEPTLHPELPELLEWAWAHEKIDFVLLNTNGVRLAKDDTFFESLKAIYNPTKNLELYLQFDGVQEAGHHHLRGGDLRALKVQAIERAGAINLPITLAMTVTSDSIEHLWGAAAFGLQYPHVRGIAYQPIFGSGRRSSEIAAAQEHVEPLSSADIINGLIAQSGGTVTTKTFTPLPCGDPNCHQIGYLFKLPGGPKSVGDVVDFQKLQGFLRDRANYNLNDLARCGCEEEPLGQLVKQMELDPSRTFRLFVKPFMDCRTWDEHRIDRCCTHVIGPDGKLDSFCRYYGGFSPKKIVL